MITILGASGFIGSKIVTRLQQLGIEYLAPSRDEQCKERNLGDVIYCIGLTSDFRSRPFDTVDAHVCKLLEVLRDCEFDSLLYLSSTRLYGTHLKIAREEDAVQLCPLNPSDLYNISKAMGEALSFASGKKVRVARLSNVYGGDYASDNFLSAIIREALDQKRVTLRTSMTSEKDYVSVADVVDGLIKIATEGHSRVYNLASGTNVSNRQLTRKLSELTGSQFDVAPEAPTIIFPEIDINRMRQEFGFQPASALDNISDLVDLYKRHGG